MNTACYAMLCYAMAVKRRTVRYVLDREYICSLYLYLTLHENSPGTSYLWKQIIPRITRSLISLSSPFPDPMSACLPYPCLPWEARARHRDDTRRLEKILQTHTVQYLRQTDGTETWARLGWMGYDEKRSAGAWMAALAAFSLLPEGK